MPHSELDLSRYWIVHVNRNVIQRNAHKPPSEREPAVRIQKGKRGKPKYGMRVRLGPSEMIYSPDEALLPCGAKMILITETEPEVVA
jgi:hypothetical protein